MRDLIFDLVENIVGTSYGSLPAGTVEIAKKFVLDTLGVAIAGSSAPGCPEIVQQLAYWGGREEATVLVFGHRLPSFLAAFANATLAHARDFDDTHDKAVLHSYAPIFPAALAAAEQKGSISGKELITAVVLGVDLACRLSLASSLPARQSGWHLTATLGVFGATAAAGKVLGLDEEKMVNALGIAYSQVAGNLQCVRDGALTKRMQPGFSAKAGVFSAIMADRGIIGVRNILEGSFGYFNVYARGQYDARKVTDDLGRRFEVDNLSAKPYPCCRYNHAGIDVTLQTITENAIKPEEVQRVVLRVPPITLQAVGKPFEITGNPQVAAQFSLPYTVAVAVVHQDVLIDHFEEKAISDPRVLEMAKRVKVLSNGDNGGGFAPVSVEIKTGHKTYRKRVETVKGDPDYPMSMKEFLKKFHNCVKHSARPLAENKVTQAIQRIQSLEQMEDVGELPRLLVQ